MLGRHFILRDRLVNWNGKKARMQIATDITEREMERRALQHALEGEQVNRDCIALLYNAKTLAEALEDLLERVGKHFGADRAYFFQFSGKTFQLSREWRAINLTERRYRMLDIDRFQQWSLWEKQRVSCYQGCGTSGRAAGRTAGRGLSGPMRPRYSQPCGHAFGNKTARCWDFGDGKRHPRKNQRNHPLLLSLRYFLLSTIRRINL